RHPLGAAGRHARQHRQRGRLRPRDPRPLLMPAPANITPSGGAYVGATVSLRAFLRAADGSPITGAADSLTVRVRHEDAGSSTSYVGSGGGIAEEGGGLY